MATTLKTILAEARAVVPEEGPLDVQRRLASGGQTVLIDVRDPDEYRDGYIEPATNVSRGFLEFRVGSVVGDSETPIVLYCQTGLRSMLAAKALKDLGYSNVVNLQGGYQKWVQSGLPVGKASPPATWSTTRASWPASRTCTARSSSSRAWPRCSRRTRGRATAASIRRRRPPVWCRRAPRPVCWVCCPESWAWSRPPRRSSCCSVSVSR